MSESNLSACVNFDQADRTARQLPKTDINASLSPCPASQRDLYVVPVRYALSEMQADHASFLPGVSPESRPMAARRLRQGFLYLWHKEGPVQRYGISPQGLLAPQDLGEDDTVVMGGTLTGLALDKHYDAWMMFTEYPLSLEQCQALSDSPGKRSEHMRHIALQTVADELKAPHCPPVKAASQVMAELIPEVYAQALKNEKREGRIPNTDWLGKRAQSNPNDASTSTYLQAMHRHYQRENAIARYPDASDEPVGQWSIDAWDAHGTQEWLDSVKDQENGLFSVFACLDDDTGVLRDINSEQALIEAEHEQWTADNNLRLTVGGFIHSLVTEDSAELAGNLNYRYKDRDIELTPEQAQIMLDTQRELNELAAQPPVEPLHGVSPSNVQRFAREARNQRVEAIIEPVRAFIPDDLYNDAQDVIYQYRGAKRANLANGPFSEKVAELIDLDAMNHWLETMAPTHFERIEGLHKALFADRGVYLYRSVKALWFVDYVDVSARAWLTNLGMGCLSEQCIRAEGAEQFAQFVRSGKGGPLAQVFNAWTPSLESVVADTSRLSELMAALSSDNIDATRQALSSLSKLIVDDLGSIAKDAHAPWAVLVSRISASLLLLKSEQGFSTSWLTVFITARLGGNARLQSAREGGRLVWKLFGQQVDGLNRWVKDTAHAIGTGHVKGIVDSPFVQKSGGVVPLAALLLNTMNAANYLAQADALEGVDSQRWNDTVSASMYAAAALVGVIDQRVRVGMGIQEIVFKLPKVTPIAPTLTLFGGVVGLFSSVAAVNELQSLQSQIERAGTHVDPWMKVRRNAVGFQVIAFGAQAIIGLGLTVEVLIGRMATKVAIKYFKLFMGPLNWIILALGVIYLIAWYFEKTPLQNFLETCCWSKSRANNFGPIASSESQHELGGLYEILYTPKVSMKSRLTTEPSNNGSGWTYSSAVSHLTIDLPSALPDTAHVELLMIGDPIDAEQLFEQTNNRWFPDHNPPRPWRDMGPYWLPSATCEWIPVEEGQGLRLTGSINAHQAELGSEPSTLSVRVRYRIPLMALIGKDYFVGGENGVAYTLRLDTGIVALRGDPTRRLDSSKVYILGKDQPGINKLQPEGKK